MRLNRIFTLVVALFAAVFSATLTHLNASPLAQAHTAKTLVGAFDLGPAGDAENVPYSQGGGNFWLSKIWSPLVSYNEDASGLKGQLANKWSSDKSLTNWTFDLRKDVKWHDGKPFSANDVIFTFKLAQDPKFGWYADAGVLEVLKKVVKINRHKIRFELSRPDSTFPEKLIRAFILPEHQLKNKSLKTIKRPDWLLNSGVGTGPFKVKKYVKGQYHELEANPLFWKGKPKIDRLLNRYFQDEASAVLAFQSGEIHFMPAEAPTVDILKKRFSKKNKTVQEFSDLTQVGNFIIFNLRSPVMKEFKVRKAISKGIDRKALIHSMFADTAVVLPTIFAPKEFWPIQDPFGFNTNQAKDELKKASVKITKPLNLWTYYTAQVHKNTIELIQQHLKSIGIPVSIRYFDNASFMAQLPKGKEWDLAYIGLGTARGMPIRHALTANSETSDKFSWGGYQDKKIDNLILKAETSTSNKTYNETMRELGSYLSKKLYFFPLFVAKRFAVVSENVEDFHWTPVSGGGPFEDHAEKWNPM